MKNQIQIDKAIESFKKEISVPSDKSISIRCILLSSIALGKSKLFNLLESSDVINAINAMKAIGVKCVKKKKFFRGKRFRH